MTENSMWLMAFFASLIVAPIVAWPIWRGLGRNEGKGADRAIEDRAW